MSEEDPAVEGSVMMSRDYVNIKSPAGPPLYIRTCRQTTVGGRLGRFHEVLYPM